MYPNGSPGPVEPNVNPGPVNPNVNPVPVPIIHQSGRRVRSNTLKNSQSTGTRIRPRVTIRTGGDDVVPVVVPRPRPPTYVIPVPVIPIPEPLPVPAPFVLEDGEWDLLNRSHLGGALLRHIHEPAEMCEHINLIRQGLFESIGSQEHLGFVGLGGAVLLRLLENDRGFDPICYAELSVLPVHLAAFAAQDFSARADLGAFCNSKQELLSEGIVALFGENWHQRADPLLAGFDGAATRAARRETAYLPMLFNVCRNLRDVPAVKRVAFAHELYLEALVDYNRRGDIDMFRVRRTDVLDDSVAALNRAPARGLRTGMFAVEFVGEAANGDGLTREWFELVRDAMFGAPAGLFAPTESEPTGYLQAARDGPLDWAGQTQYLAAGRLLALSVMANSPVGVYFPVMFFAKLMDVQLAVQDVEVDAPDTFANAVRWSEDPSQLTGIDFDDGRPVTADNADEYLTEYVNSMVADSPALTAVIEGFRDVIPVNVAQNWLTPAVLKQLVMGAVVVDVEDLIAHLNVHADLDSAGRREGQWLREILREYASTGETRPKLREFLRFVTGSSVPPVGGFATLPHHLTVSHFGTDDNLPTSSTCTFLLKLPHYTSKAIMAARIDYAISNQGGAMED